MSERDSTTKVSQAIRDIERVEDELANTDGMQDTRERLTNARSNLVEALLEDEYDELRHE